MLDIPVSDYLVTFAKEDHIQLTITCELDSFAYNQVSFRRNTYFLSWREEILQPAKVELDLENEPISSCINCTVVGGNDLQELVALLRFFKQFRIKNCKVYSIRKSIIRRSLLSEKANQ